MKLALTMILCFALQSCAYSVHQVHVSDFAKKMPKKMKIVEAQAEQLVILGFAFDTNYVDQAVRKLKKKCRGSIDGITTKYSTDLGFYSWTNKITLKGICRRS